MGSHLCKSDSENLFYLFADHDLTQDTMQDTFMKAWKYIGNTTHLAIQNEKAWLMRATMKTCRDYRRTLWFKRIDFKASLDELLPR